MACTYEQTTAQEVSRLTDGLLSACRKLEQDTGTIPATASEAVVYCRNVSVPDMKAARSFADRLEVLTDAKYWPFPVYSDMLFYV